MRKVLAEIPRGETEFVTIGQTQYGLKLCQKIIWYMNECGVPVVVIQWEYGLPYYHVLAIIKKHKAGTLRADYKEIEIEQKKEVQSTTTTPFIDITTTPSFFPLGAVAPVR